MAKSLLTHMFSLSLGTFGYKILAQQDFVLSLWPVLWLSTNPCDCHFLKNKHKPSKINIPVSILSYSVLPNKHTSPNKYTAWLNHKFKLTYHTIKYMYAITNSFHTLCMEKAANVYFLTQKGRYLMQKHQSLRKNKLFSQVWHGKGLGNVLSDIKRPEFFTQNKSILFKNSENLLSQCGHSKI